MLEEESGDGRGTEDLRLVETGDLSPAKDGLLSSSISSSGLTEAWPPGTLGGVCAPLEQTIFESNLPAVNLPEKQLQPRPKGSDCSWTEVWSNFVWWSPGILLAWLFQHAT